MSEVWERWESVYLVCEASWRVVRCVCKVWYWDGERCRGSGRGSFIEVGSGGGGSGDGTGCRWDRT